MRRFLARRAVWEAVLFVLIDTFWVGVGMGVPFFNILLGVPLGAYIAWRLVAGQAETRAILGKLLLVAAATSAFTLVLMAVIWGGWAGLLFDPAADYANTGIPLILFEPKASFIGWLGLMILVSPFLQLLTTLFGAHVTWWAMVRKSAPHGRATAGRA